MKAFLSLLVVIIFAVIFTLLAAEDPGFVVIGRGNWTIESSLALFSLVFILIVIITAYFTPLLVRLIRLPYQIWQWRISQQRVRDSLQRSIFALAHADWRTAEQSAIKFVQRSETPIFHYLTAAIACQHNGDWENVSQYLQKARAALNAEQGDARLTVRLVSLLLAWQQQQLSQALQGFRELHAEYPRNPIIFKSLFVLAVELLQWQEVLNLLPEARKYKIASTEQLQNLEENAYLALFQQKLALTEIEQAKILWQKQPKIIRQLPAAQQSLVNYLVKLGEMGLADAILTDTLKNHWHIETVLLYAHLDSPDPHKQLAFLENNLKNRMEEVGALLALGIAHARYGMLEKAQYFLENGLNLGKSPYQAQLYQNLAQIYEKRQDYVRATQCYRALFTPSLT